MRKLMVVAFGVALALGLPSAAAAQEGPALPVPGYGNLLPPSEVANRPDPLLRYRVAFEVTRTASDAGEVNPALDRVARFVNLLGAAGVRPAAGDIVVVVHGPATTALLSDAAYRDRFKRPNPNAALVAELQAAGVAIHVCSYALVGQQVERASLLPNVTLDLAAMVTLATLQLKGWAAIIG